jgi:hypothetical protein
MIPRGVPSTVIKLPLIGAVAADGLVGIDAGTAAGELQATTSAQKLNKNRFYMLFIFNLILNLSFITLNK